MEFLPIIAALIIGLVAGFVVGRRRAVAPPKKDGTLEVTKDSKSIFSLDLDIEPEELAERTRISIEVSRKKDPGSSS